MERVNPWLVNPTEPDILINADNSALSLLEAAIISSLTLIVKLMTCSSLDA